MANATMAALTNVHFCIQHFSAITKATTPIPETAMLCVPSSGKGPFTWDVRITCTSEQHHVYVGLKYHGGCLFKDGAIENFALVTEHGFDKNRSMDIYFIATTKKTLTNPKEYWRRVLHETRCGDLNKLPEHADITHARLFSRM